MPVMPRTKSAKKISDKIIKSPFPREKKSKQPEDQGGFGRDIHDMANATMKKHPPIDI